MVKKIVVFLVVAMAFSAVAVAQTNDVYWVNYFANRNNSAVMDADLRIINPGEQGTPMTAGQGTVCADIYVFDNTQEMVECCSCPITADGIISLSLLEDLTANPLTSFAPNLGVIKIVSDVQPVCNAQLPIPGPDLRSYATHISQPVSGTYVTTEGESLPATLTAAEQAFLGQACSFVQYLGSGKGVCDCQ